LQKLWYLRKEANNWVFTSRVFTQYLLGIYRTGYLPDGIYPVFTGYQGEYITDIFPT